MYLLVRAQIPNFDLRVGARGGHVPAVRIHRHGTNGTAMGQHLHEGVSHVGRPQRDGAVAVAEVRDGVLGIMGHRVARAELGAKLRDDLAVGGVLIPKDALLADRGEQKMVGKEIQAIRLSVLLQAVNLDAPVIVDVHVLLLRGGEKLPAVKELDVARGLLELHLGDELVVSPANHGDVPFATAHQKVATIGGEIDDVRAEGRKVEVERFACGVDVDCGGELSLLKTVGALHALGFHGAGGGRQEPLLVQRGVRRRLIRERLRVAHMRLGLAIGDLLRVDRRALGELLRAGVQLALQALLARHHVLDFSTAAAALGRFALHHVTLAPLVHLALAATLLHAPAAGGVERGHHHTARSGTRARKAAPRRVAADTFRDGETSAASLSEERAIGIFTFH